MKTKKLFVTPLLIGLMMISMMACSPAQTAQTTDAAATEAATAAATEATTAATEATTASVAAQGNSLPISDEKITLTAFWPIPANVMKFRTSFNECSIYPVLEEQTNIHIDWQHPASGVEQFNLMINSGDLADIIHMPNLREYSYPGGGDKAIADGAYLRLNEPLEQYGEHYLKLVDSTPEFRRDSRTDTGNIWHFAMVETDIQGPFDGMALRLDWLDDLGMEPPVTYDDWHEMLVAFRDQKGASAPLLLPTNVFHYAYALIAGYDAANTMMQIDGKVTFGPLEPGFKEFIGMLAQWYSEGLIDQEFATRDGDSLNQLKYTGEAGAWNDGFWMFEYNKVHSTEPDKFREYAVANPVRTEGGKAHLRQVNYNVRDEGAVVSAQSEYAIEAVRWLDNLYSEENYILTNYGIEGEGHTRGADGEYILGDMITNNPDGIVMAEALYIYSMHDGPMWRIWDREKPGWSEDEIAAEEVWYAADADYTIPLISMTAEESNEYNNIMSDINTLVAEMSVRYVSNQEDMSTFDGFVEQIRSMNIARAVEIQQAALERYNNR